MRKTQVDLLREDIKKIEDKIDHIVFTSLPRIHEKIDEVNQKVIYLEAQNKSNNKNNNKNNIWMKYAFQTILVLAAIIATLIGVKNSNIFGLK